MQTVFVCCFFENANIVVPTLKNQNQEIEIKERRKKKQEIGTKVKFQNFPNITKSIKKHRNGDRFVNKLYYYI